MDTSETYIKMCEKAEEIQTIPHTAVAYLAGLIDGEGTVSIRRKVGNHFNIELYVTSTNKPMLEWIVKIFGGTIYTYQRKGDTTRLPQQKWHTHGKQAEDILRMVLPYLIIKGEHARLAIEFREKMNRDTSWHREFANKVKTIQKTITYTEPQHQITQDQLQEMIEERPSPKLFARFLYFLGWDGATFSAHRYPQTDAGTEGLTSMEQLWLTFVMKDNNKVWDGGQWVKNILRD